MRASEGAHEVTAPALAEEPAIGRESGDRVVRLLTHGIWFTIVTILCVLLYALLSGVVNPPAPRTIAESTLYSMSALVKQRPTDGKAWADYVEALYATGDKAGAWAALKEGRKKVEHYRTIRQLNVAEVHLLILDGKNKEAVDKSTTYIQNDIDIRTQENARNFERLIVVPYMQQDNAPTVRMFVLRATAQGNLKQWKDAIVSFDNALKLQPEAADVIVMRGWAKVEASDTAGAKKDFEEGLKYLPNDATALRGLQQVKAK